MSKLYIIYLLCCAIPFETTCMLKKWDYPPYVLKDNPRINSIRTNLDIHDGRLAPAIHPQVKFLSYAENDEITQKCDYFALKKTMYVAQNLTFQEAVEFAQNNFHQTQKPQPNDLVIYTISDTDLRVTHFAIVGSVIKAKKTFLPKKNKADFLFISKWGENPEIFEHAPSAVPLCYGMAYGIYTLNS